MASNPTPLGRKTIKDIFLEHKLLDAEKLEQAVQQAKPQKPYNRL
jgi:hypothetical protein